MLLMLLLLEPHRDKEVFVVAVERLSAPPAPAPKRIFILRLPRLSVSLTCLSVDKRLGVVDKGGIKRDGC